MTNKNSNGIDESPTAQNDAPQTLEHRSAPRFRVKWPVIVTINGDASHRGQLRDISTQGASVLLERNLQLVKAIMLHIHIPTVHMAHESRIVQVSGKAVYAVYDSNAQLFRVGVSFREFMSPDDIGFLEARLTNYHTPS